MEELALHQPSKFSTYDSELAAWLLYCGCTLLETTYISKYESLVTLSCPDNMLTQWLSDYANYKGKAEPARGMFKQYKDLVSRINRDRNDAKGQEK